MRIGGLASGIDTQTIIQDLMKVERKPLDRIFQRKQTVEWQRDAYREMSLALKNLEQEAYNKIRFRSSLNTKVATSSNSAAFTATANPDVQNGTYVVEVKQVATKTRNLSSTTISNAGTPISASSSMDSQSANFQTAPVNGSTFTLTTSSGTQTFTVDTSKSLNDLFKQINDSPLGVKAYYDSTYDKVVIERKETGDFKGTNQYDIVIDDPDGFLGNTLKIAQTGEVSGQNAIIDFTDPVFGQTITEESKSNTVIIGGMTITAIKQTDLTVEDTITVTSNTDKAFDNIKAFVDKYNETIALIQAKINEPRYRDYPPLTDDQRRELSEREAEMWDEKAKSGLLRRDNTLSSVLNKMRTDLYSPVETTGQFNQLTEIGITTTSNFRDGGKLVIDETKLRQALADDSDSVHQLFNNVADSTATPTEQYNQTGLVGRIRKTIDVSIQEIVKRAGNEYRTSNQYTLGRELIDLDSQIDRFQRRLGQIEDRYWAQFSRMEQAVNQANAQGASLMSFMSGGQ